MITTSTGTACRPLIAVMPKCHDGKDTDEGTKQVEQEL